MKKYYVHFDDLCDDKPEPQPGFTDHEVYIASDVHALLDRCLDCVITEMDEATEGLRIYEGYPERMRRYQRRHDEAKALHAEIKSLMGR
jgi:hypothetical protein